MPQSEWYQENILIRQDGRPPVKGETLFNDDDCDKTYEFEGKLMLRQIEKSVQNASHNTHTYVFTIESIDKLKEED